ncbi:serine carboxypeptidase-like 45 [Aristolochia californica]|uniref:serine carboxypeptidase-like 45 n=1 Tax=Aristolochia californica TaxID=171875 RepID=UPI0035D6BC0E
MAWWLLLSFFFFFFFSSFVSETCSELITALPGQPPNVKFSQHSGYIVTDPHDGRALFYYFVEADVADPCSRPLTLWLNGGPGCSSLGFGAFMEHGPFQPGDNGALVQNKYSWNLESNVLYVETPIGVGFSYSNTSSNYINWNDIKTAEENLRFILNWLEEFPMYKDSELYLTGESYAGHYIPQLAALILQYNKQQPNKMINLKAIALGNPLLDLDISVKAGDHLWSHGAISDKTLELEKTVCDDTRYLREYYHDKWSQECNDVFNRVEYEIGDVIDRGDLLLPRCLSSSGAQQAISGGKHGQIHAKLARRKYGDPCLGDRVFAYLNLPQVQVALHANTTHLPYHWDFCLGPLEYQEDNVDMDIIPVVAYLIHEGIPVMLYSGDQDTKIPLTQTRIITNKLAKGLQLKEFTQYGPWYDKQQVGGWAQSFGTLRDGRNVTYLTFATVRGAAHEVPFTSPSQALTLFRAFLAGSPLTPS